MSGAIRKGGVYFSNDIYGEIDFTDLENLKLKTIIDGVETDYDVGGGSVEGFGLLMNPAPPTEMKIGDVFKFTLSNATSDVKVSVQKDGIVEFNYKKDTMTAVGVGITNVSILDGSKKLESRVYFNVTVTK